jgi:hypothetical protein
MEYAARMTRDEVFHTNTGTPCLLNFSGSSRTLGVVSRLA